jgi:hypothetical protein
LKGVVGELEDWLRFVEGVVKVGVGRPVVVRRAVL